MKVLICGATSFELEGLRSFLQNEAKSTQPDKFQWGQLDIELLITGIGAAFTAYALGKYFATYPKPDLAIQMGIAGTFHKTWPLAQVYAVIQDQFADLGAENADASFSDLFSMKFLEPDQFPFQQGVLIADDLPVVRHLPKAKAISVNLVSGTTTTIDFRLSHFNADLESMEGAIFSYICLQEGIPHIQIRSTSNYVEIRNKERWKIKESLEVLNETMIRLVTDLKRSQV